MIKKKFLVLFISFYALFVPDTSFASNLSRMKGTKIITDSTLNLSNKSILVTAPSHYAPRLARIIKNANGNPVVAPVIETIANPDTKKIDQILENPENYDWVVLPSRKAIEVFFQRAGQKSVSGDRMRSIKFCAIGKDAEYLEKKYNVTVALEPSEPSPKGITETLSELENIRGQTIAVIAPKVEGITEPDVIPDFIQGLKAIGLDVRKIEGYITRPVELEIYKEILVLVRNNQVDLIAFTSTAEIEALIHLLGDVKFLNENMVACFGPYTAANAKKLGVDVDFIGKNFHSFEDYVEGIASYFEKNDQ